jgi:hypothetical protein
VGFGPDKLAALAGARSLARRPRIRAAQSPIARDGRPRWLDRCWRALTGVAQAARWQSRSPAAEEGSLRTRSGVAGAIGVAIAGSGCAAIWGADPPADLRPARAAIHAAEEVGATADPIAAVHLGLARGELANAERLGAAGQPREAASWAARAESDAELAVLAARATSVRDAAKRTLEEAGALRGALGRDGGPP